MSAEVENSDPAYGREGALGVAKETFDNRVVHVTPLDGSVEAKRGADLTNAWLEASFKVLSASDVNRKREAAGKLPGNFILTARRRRSRTEPATVQGEVRPLHGVLR